MGIATHVEAGGEESGESRSWSQDPSRDAVAAIGSGGLTAASPSMAERTAVARVSGMISGEVRAVVAHDEVREPTSYMCGDSKHGSWIRGVNSYCSLNQSSLINGTFCKLTWESHTAFPMACVTNRELPCTDMRSAYGFGVDDSRALKAIVS